MNQVPAWGGKNPAIFQSDSANKDSTGTSSGQKNTKHGSEKHILLLDPKESAYETASHKVTLRNVNKVSTYNSVM